MKKMNERKKNPVRLLMCLLMMAMVIFGATAVSAAENEVTVQFRDSNGRPVSNAPDMTIQEGESIVLPKAPVVTNRTVAGQPSWKTTAQVTEGTQYFESGNTMRLDRRAGRREYFNSLRNEDLYLPLFYK